MHMFTLELLLLLCMHMIHLVAKSHKYIHYKWWIQGHADIKFYSASVIPLVDDVTGFCEGMEVVTPGSSSVVVCSENY